MGSRETRQFTPAKQAVFALLISLTPVCVCAQSPTGDSIPTILVTDGTPIHLVLMDDLQGKKVDPQTVVHFKVREDLLVQSKVIVKTGTEAIAHVESVSKSGLLGKSGRLILQFDYVTTTSGTKILLRGGAGVKGGKGGALTAISATWFGPDATLPVGTAVNAYVSTDQRTPAP